MQEKIQSIMKAPWTFLIKNFSYQSFFFSSYFIEISRFIYFTGKKHHRINRLHRPWGISLSLSPCFYSLLPFKSFVCFFSTIGQYKLEFYLLSTVININALAVTNIPTINFECILLLLFWLVSTRTLKLKKTIFA